MPPQERILPGQYSVAARRRKRAARLIPQRQGLNIQMDSVSSYGKMVLVMARAKAGRVLII
jgi:hypothetical protein